MTVAEWCLTSTCYLTETGSSFNDDGGKKGNFADSYLIIPSRLFNHKKLTVHDI